MLFFFFLLQVGTGLKNEKEKRGTSPKKTKTIIGEPINQLPYKRPTEGWKKWVEIPNLEK